jgi:serine/threonine protein kinase
MTPAACPTSGKFNDLLEDQLSTEESRQIDEHLRVCPACLAKLEKLICQREELDLPGLARSDVETPSFLHGAQEEDTAEINMPAGTSVGPCELIRELGRGGMGVVYEAHHRELNRAVAVKILAVPLMGRKEAATRFTYEVRAMARLKHPGIVEVYDAGVQKSAATQSGVPYAVIELVSGPSLKSFLAKTGPLPSQVAAKLVEDIARAVHHAHEKGVVHRDLKPSNILLAGVPLKDEGGRMKDEPETTKVGDQRSEVSEQKPEDTERKTECKELKIEDGAQKSEVSEDKTEVKEQKTEVSEEKSEVKEEKKPEDKEPNSEVKVEQTEIKEQKIEKAEAGSSADSSFSPQPSSLPECPQPSSAPAAVPDSLQPKIVDFGLAKLLDEECGLTASQDILGTPEYIAPELGVEGGKIDHRVDVYALGVILFECLTGDVPFRGSSSMQTLLVAQSRPAQAPSAVQAGVDKTLDAIVLKCLAKDPTKRYPSAAALADDLAKFRRGELVQGRTHARRHLAFAAIALALIAGAIAILLSLGSDSPAHGVPEEPKGTQPSRDDKADRLRAPKPTEFASVFALDRNHLPADEQTFEKLVKKVKAANFNVIYCAYSDARLDVCKKHGIKMMVDLLDPDYHVSSAPDAAKALCNKLRGETAVWGYNIWNDPIGTTAAARRRDIANVREWDPTHPAFCGTERTTDMDGITNADVIGFFDFHWKQDRDKHFAHLLRYASWANERDAIVLRWVGAEAGTPGLGNVRRSRYTHTTSIACGVKGVMWFLGNRQIDLKTLELTQLGKDAAEVNKCVEPLRTELMKIGNPIAIYSTEVSRTANNEVLPEGKKTMMPPGLEQNGFPSDFWVEPVAGEFVCGVFKDTSDETAPDRLFLANHNAYVPQDVTLALPTPRKAWIFLRRTAKWEPLVQKNGTVTFKLAPGGGELLKFE